MPLSQKIYVYMIYTLHYTQKLTQKWIKDLNIRAKKYFRRIQGNIFMTLNYQ